MIKLDPSPTSLTYKPNSDVDLGCPGRLLVLVPTDIEYSAATRRIWELAHATGMPVRLLGLCRDATEEPRLHRELVTMASLLQDSRVHTEANVDIGTSWMEAVKCHYQPGDMIVCFTEQRTGLLQRPLGQVLESNFKATVYILSGHTLEKPKSNTLPQIAAWLGFIALIAGFGILQANLVRLSEGWLQNVLLSLSITLEFWLIWVWNRLVA